METVVNRNRKYSLNSYEENHILNVDAHRSIGAFSVMQ